MRVIISCVLPGHQAPDLALSRPPLALLIIGGIKITQVANEGT